MKRWYWLNDIASVMLRIARQCERSAVNAVAVRCRLTPMSPLIVCAALVASTTFRQPQVRAGAAGSASPPACTARRQVDVQFALLRPAFLTGSMKV